MADYTAPIIAAITTGLNAAAKGGPRRQYKWGKKMATYTNQLNRENAEWTLQQNRILAQEQREYDSPKMQMQRWLEAGMNPHLAYSQGNPGNMNSPVAMGSIPSVNFGHIDTSYSDVGSDFQGALLAQSQIDLQQTKVAESLRKQEIMDVQKSILDANPYLRPAYVDAIVQQMSAIGSMKALESGWYNQTDEKGNYKAHAKMDAELNALQEKYNLLKSDSKVKAQIIESKQWENDIKEVQARWMKDGDMTPQVIFEGIIKLLGMLK